MVKLYNPFEFFFSFLFRFFPFKPFTMVNFYNLWTLLFLQSRVKISSQPSKENSIYFPVSSLLILVMQSLNNFSGWVELGQVTTTAVSQPVRMGTAMWEFHLLFVQISSVVMLLLVVVVAVFVLGVTGEEVRYPLHLQNGLTLAGYMWKPKQDNKVRALVFISHG